jgi:Iap family predicted aminopeptidase
MRKNKLLLNVTPEQLIADFERIKSLKKLKEYYNISFVTLYSAFEIIGYDCKRNTTIPDMTKEYLEELYCKLGTLKQVARFLNCDPGTVKNKMISFGL